MVALLCMQDISCLMCSLPRCHPSPSGYKAIVVHQVSTTTIKAFSGQSTSEILLADVIMMSSKGSSHSAILPCQLLR